MQNTVFYWIQIYSLLLQIGNKLRKINITAPKIIFISIILLFLVKFISHQIHYLHNVYPRHLLPLAFANG